MYFELLRDRLRDALRLRLRNGRLTERSLARLTGISQPHVHNVLKGARILSPEMADLILKKLGMSVLDLIDAGEFEAVMAARNLPLTFTRVPLLAGFVGPGHAWPEAISLDEAVWIRGAHGRGTAQLAAARLAKDTQMKMPVGAGCVALLDVGESSRTLLDPGAYYGISYQGESCIRRLRIVGRSVYLLADVGAGVPENWPRVSFSAGGQMELVRGRVLTAMPPEAQASPPQTLGLLPDTSR